MRTLVASLAYRPTLVNPAVSPGIARLVRAVALGISIAILVAAIRDVLFVWTQGPFGGVDYHQYMDATRRWLDGGTFYEPYQLTGPYEVRYPAILYPPVALWLFVPFTVLPEPLWWIGPLAAFGFMLYKLRPSPWAWPVIAACLAWLPSSMAVLTGNPGMWAAAAMAFGVVFAGPAVFVLIKPTLFPFALWRAWHRRWWMYLLAFALLSAPFGTMWADWLTAMLNSRDGPWGGGILYNIGFVPMMAIPLVAWVARSATHRNGAKRSAPPDPRPDQAGEASSMVPGTFSTPMPILAPTRDPSHATIGIATSGNSVIE